MVASMAVELDDHSSRFVTMSALPDLTTPTEVEILDRRTVFQGYFRIDRYQLRHARFDGGWTAPMTREVFERGHAAGLLPYDPTRDEFVMCQEFRVGAYAGGMDPWQIECVAGIVEAGETPEDVARRETLEEAGCVALDLMPIQRYLVSPGGASESTQLYLGRVSAENAGGIFGLEDEGEHIRVFTLSRTALRTLLQDGRIQNAATLIAVQWFFLNHDRVRAMWGGPARSEDS
jgi:ADP-ribose pyrophosphatase